MGKIPNLRVVIAKSRYALVCFSAPYVLDNVSRYSVFFRKLFHDAISFRLVSYLGGLSVGERRIIDILPPNNSFRPNPPEVGISSCDFPRLGSAPMVVAGLISPKAHTVRGILFRSSPAKICSAIIQLIPIDMSAMLLIRRLVAIENAANEGMCRPLKPLTGAAS